MTRAGERDMAALILGIPLGVPLRLIMVRSLGNTLDAPTKGVGTPGVFAFVGDRLFRQR